jgi:predicted Fe-S protein YdhL (DUF1289 family)
MCPTGRKFFNFVMTTCRTRLLRCLVAPPCAATGRELLPFVLALEHKSARPCVPGAIMPALAPSYMAAIHITDVEAAINFWREKKPSPDGVTLAPELRALAEVYALMIFYHEDEADEQGFPPAAYAAWKTWYDTMPDTPCIAICSTSQGDPDCKGCGRSFEEVQRWPEMTPAEKRQTWRRITLHGGAWRFNRYAERAGETPAAATGT